MDSTSADITAWFRARLPAAWSQLGAPDVGVDREEVTVILALDEPDVADTATLSAALDGHVAKFRDETRDRRVAIAREAEARFERKVSWGAKVNDRVLMFTHLSVPVMTRLRQPERLVLDTLVASGVARSRSDALAWCVRLVGQHTGEWLDELRVALADVERIRAAGPTAR